MEKRTPTERDRKPRYPDDADFSAFEPTRRPDGTVRRSKNFRVLATSFESVVPVLQTAADRRDDKTTQENLTRLR